MPRISPTVGARFALAAQYVPVSFFEELVLVGESQLHERLFYGAAREHSGERCKILFGNRTEIDDDFWRRTTARFGA
ncbi:MAG: hypothetical protein PVSMB1_16410 [Gemmatimonadaceae bacterium]